MSVQTWWYVARSSGLVAWGLLAASTIWGLILSTGAMRGRARANWLLDLHRFLGGIAVVFTFIHVGALLLDQYINFSLASVLVPFVSSWRPVVAAMGVVALYLLVAVEITSLLRNRIPKKWWRGVHFASFPLFVFATIHGLVGGTDSRTPLAIAIVAGTTVTIGWLTTQRLSGARPQPKKRGPRTPELAKVAVRAGR
jgi:DMSO/TMAO reductase YedYZ heme-binding membrane subunit